MPKIRVRPTKEKAVFALLGALVMVGVGFFIVIPTFGSFGYFWTAIAVLTALYNAYIAFFNRAADTEIHVDGGGGGVQDNDFLLNEYQFLPRDETEDRLLRLRGLREKGLITEEEYREKKARVLHEL